MSENNAIPQVAVTDVPAGALIVDVREPNEYAAGHAPGVLPIPLGELRDRVAEVPRDSEVYVICRSGVRSQKAAEFLAEEGLQARNIAGGTLEWFSQGLSLESETDAEASVVAPTTKPPEAV